jgi:hypothetical protein
MSIKVTIELDTQLDVVNKYQELVNKSLDSDSVYIRMKETMSDMLDKGDIDETVKAEVISNVLTSMSTSIASSSMSLALQWSSSEAELKLKKATTEAELELLAEKIKLTEAQKAQVYTQDIAAQSGSVKTDGLPTVVDGRVVALGKGTKDTEEELVAQKVKQAVKETELVQLKKTETNAGIHKLVADTYVNYGTYAGYTISETGVTGVTRMDTNKSLSDQQLMIATEQAKGYVYNAWASAASGASATIGTVISADKGELLANYSLIDDFSNSIKKLADLNLPSV